ncbi:fatty acid synthase [Bemisia tabaci]|uniref:fatty acid synthase n=1 Tax=Bemisia tabaci TaxID=7038 RepID=UPI003B28369B
MDVLENLYRKHNINPAHIEYIEADGSGLQDRDGKEVEAIIDFFCKDRSRSSKLLIGSCKSNIGHLDTAAPAASVVKTIFALNKCKVPPTINHTSPIPELAQSNDVQVVTSATPCDGNLMGVNGISLWGGFGHIILQGNPRKTSKMKISEKFPQILLLSSRTEEGIDQILRKVKTVKITPEFAALSNDVFSKGIKFHMHRGYTIVNPEATQIPHKIQTVDIHDRPLWYVFSGMGSQWAGMGSQLLHIPVFRAAIERCDQVLKPHGVDLLHIITTPDEAIFDNILNCFVGITAIQIGLIDVMRVLKLEPNGMIGHSVGELGCAYADNCLTLEQTILSAFLRGKASLEATLIKGMMAAIGIGYHDIVKILPPTIDVACRNSASSCTLSGPAEDVEAFVKQLKAKGIFAKAVNVANIAYHSRYIQPAGPILLKYLKQVIQKETSRSSKWVSTSIPEHRWDTELALYSSAEYLANNLLSPVLFEDVLKHIPPNAVMVEIAPHGLLQAILKRAVPNVNLALAKRTKSEDAVKFLLEAIGQ